MAGAAFFAAAFVAGAAFFAGADFFAVPAFVAGLREITLRAAEAAEPASDFLVLRAMDCGLPRSWRVVAGATVSSGG